MTDAKSETSDHIEPESLLEVAHLVAKRAGDHALSLIAGKGARESLREHATTKSSATDLVSAADREVEQIIVSSLAKLRPKDGILGEEGATHPSSTGIDWIIDPIDGTTNFLYANGSFAVSIAAYAGSKGLAGVVYDPIREETFCGVLGGSTTLNGRTLHLPPTAPPLDEALLGTGFHYVASRRLAQARLLVTILPAVRDIRRHGVAALDLCSVAAGRLDAYYEAELKPWDMAAGLIIANGAGSLHTMVDLGDELHETLLLSHPDLLEPMRGLLLQAALAGGASLAG